MATPSSKSDARQIRFAAASSRAICEWHASEPHVTHDSVTNGPRFGSIRRFWANAFKSRPRREDETMPLYLDEIYFDVPGQDGFKNLHDLIGSALKDGLPRA